MGANTHTHTQPHKWAHIWSCKRTGKHASGPVQHGPGGNPIYKQWLDTDYILPCDIRYLLIIKWLWKCVKEREQFRAPHQTSSFLRHFLERIGIRKGPENCSGEPLIFFICGVPPSTTQQRLCDIQWHLRKCEFILLFLFP